MTPVVRESLLGYHPCSRNLVSIVWMEIKSDVRSGGNEFVQRLCCYQCTSSQLVPYEGRHKRSKNKNKKETGGNDNGKNNEN